MSDNCKICPVCAAPNATGALECRLCSHAFRIKFDPVTGESPPLEPDITFPDWNSRREWIRPASALVAVTIMVVVGIYSIRTNRAAVAPKAPQVSPTHVDTSSQNTESPRVTNSPAPQIPIMQDPGFQNAESPSVTNSLALGIHTDIKTLASEEQNEEHVCVYTNLSGSQSEDSASASQPLVGPLGERPRTIYANSQIGETQEAASPKFGVTAEVIREPNGTVDYRYAFANEGQVDILCANGRAIWIGAAGNPVRPGVTVGPPPSFTTENTEAAGVHESGGVTTTESDQSAPH